MDKVLKIERAKMYLDLLSKGIDPVSGQRITSDPGFPNEKIKNCFTFITEILNEYVELNRKVERLEDDNDSNKVVVMKKLKFAVTDEQCSKIKLSEKPITVMSFMKNINSVIDNDTMTRLTSTRLNKWLINRGLFYASKTQIIVNKTVYKPSELADGIGIFEEEYVNKRSGEVKMRIKLSPNAQLFILDNIQEIIETT